MKNTDYSDFLQFALNMAKQSRKISLAYFNKGVKVDYKKVESKLSSPYVTKADRECEALMRKLISKKFPDHGILGEEYGVTNKNSTFTWVLDPIDGTAHFIKNIPTWGTLIALLHNGKPIVGVADFPTYNKTMYGHLGGGTWCNGKRLHVSNISKVSDAIILSLELKWAKPTGYRKQIIDLLDASHQSEINSTPFNFYRVCKGEVESFLYATKIKLWDVAPFILLVKEAGGLVTGFDGDPDIVGKPGLFSNKKIHKKVLGLLNKN